tara:strand:+ start:24260 stop:25729 length:1470 start_codon:yes stop_codon:yes gene_type:complete
MYYPKLKDIESYRSLGNLVPIYRTINADLETPVSAYLKVAEGDYSFLLESVSGGEQLSRYSFIGTTPYKVIKTGKDQPQGPVDPLTLIQEELSKFQEVSVEGLPAFNGGGVGYLSYDNIHYFEPRVPMLENDDISLPDSVVMFTDTLLVFDHLRHDIKIVSHVNLNDDIEESYQIAVSKIESIVTKLTAPLPPQSHNIITEIEPTKHEVKSNFSKEEFFQAVNKCIEYINQGDAIQIVLSQRFERKTEAKPFDIYRSLRALNPSPYMYHLHLSDFHIVGASIETLVKVENGLIDYHPIAGTRPRGQTQEEDNALAEELRTSEKQTSEHIMLVDLGRNDVGKVSEIGTVEVTDLMSIEKYSHVMHLVSHIKGVLKSGLNPFDALRSCFPAGTLSGAPKIRAMEIISELEQQKRGPYAGAVGYFSFSGNIDTCITLRTSVIKDGTAYIQAGGGVVADSTDEDEYLETYYKSGALLKAIENAELQFNAKEAP